MSTFRFPSQQFRSIPAPTGTSKVGLFYTQAANVPRELWDWREVNPREVKRTSSVYTKIVHTLTQEPERFHERNRGITIVAKDLQYDEKRKEVVLKLDDTRIHGAVDGAHTLDAILEAQKQPPENSWPAYVFKKNAGESFKVLISKAPEILRLRDLIEKRAVSLPIGRRA